MGRNAQARELGQRQRRRLGGWRCRGRVRGGKGEAAACSRGPEKEIGSRPPSLMFVQVVSWVVVTVVDGRERDGGGRWSTMSATTLLSKKLAAWWPQT